MRCSFNLTKILHPSGYDSLLLFGNGKITSLNIEG
jgi:hypothetical protein